MLDFVIDLRWSILAWLTGDGAAKHTLKSKTHEPPQRSSSLPWIRAVRLSILIGISTKASESAAPFVRTLASAAWPTADLSTGAGSLITRCRRANPCFKNLRKSSVGRFAAETLQIITTSIVVGTAATLRFMHQIGTYHDKAHFRRRKMIGV
ncbi:hypothetical protein [Caballeronia sp. KNU42]